MLLVHVFTPKIAHSSYLLVGKKSCAVVDPRRDVDVYLAQARELGVRITHVLETHLHADFASGHLDLAQATGATPPAPGAQSPVRAGTVGRRQPPGDAPSANAGHLAEEWATLYSRQVWWC